MKKFILLLGCMAYFVCPILGQIRQVRDVFPKPNREVGFYEHGREVTCVDDNFVNLRNNIDRYVDKNEGVQIRNLSWKHVGEVESARQVEKLILKNFTNPPIGAYSMLTPGQAQGKYIYEGKSSFTFHPYTRDKGDRRLYKAKARYAAGYVIRKGTRIYALSFTADGKPYTTYVFVDPNTLKVITEAYCNLFWYKIPLTLIADKDKFRNHGN